MPVVPLWFNLSLFGVVAALAFWKGGPAERIYAATTIVGDVMLNGWEHSWGSNLGVEAVILSASFAIMLAVALTTDRYWPLFAVSLQLVGMATVLAQALIRIDGWAYGTSQVVWDYVSDAVLAYGVWESWRRGRRRALPG